MKKIVVITGSPRPKGNTYKVTRILEEKLQQHEDYSVEYISLKQANLEFCKGCMACMRKGEEKCPCKDQALEIRDKLLAADGIIFTSPVYVHTVNAIMKNFIDRFAYFCHQPHFVGKSALVLVTTELSGIDETLDYMKFPLNTWGLKIADRLGVAYPSYKNNPEYGKKCDKRMEKAAKRFHKSLESKKVNQSFKSHILFNLLKLKVTLHKNILPYDYQFWVQKGWLDKSFYSNRYCRVKSFAARNLVKFRSKLILKRAGVKV